MIKTMIKNTGGKLPSAGEGLDGQKALLAFPFYADKETVKNCFKLLILALAFVFALPLGTDASVVKYKEDYYKLYHIHYAQAPDDCIENIWWLEQAVKADFANPLYAMAKIETHEQWEKYRFLFQMHVNLKLIEQHLRLGRVYDKQVAYFYDAPWKDEYLRNLEKARTCYEAAYYYWREAKLWAEKASVSQYNFLFITDLQNWEDERERIVTAELDYQKTLDREIARLDTVIARYQEMEGKSY